MADPQLKPWCGLGSSDRLVTLGWQVYVEYAEYGRELGKMESSLKNGKVAASGPWVTFGSREFLKTLNWLSALKI